MSDDYDFSSWLFGFLTVGLLVILFISVILPEFNERKVNDYSLNHGEAVCHETQAYWQDSAGRDPVIVIRCMDWSNR